MVLLVHVRAGQEGREICKKFTSVGVGLMVSRILYLSISVHCFPSCVATIHREQSSCALGHGRVSFWLVLLSPLLALSGTPLFLLGSHMLHYFHSILIAAVIVRDCNL